MERVPVDIVMATNRVSPYLPEALDSVLSQSYSRWRLIVVDDGTPVAGAVSRAVATMPRARVIRQQNRGPAAARNRGVRMGDSPLIAFLDDDDVWSADKLAAQVEALATAPEALASFTGGRYIDGTGNTFGDGWRARSVPSHKFVSGEEPQPRIVSLMVRRTAHDLVGGFNESYSLAEDNDYILRLALTGSMIAVPIPLVSYRRHGHNMSTAGSVEGRRANERLLREQIAKHRGRSATEVQLRAHLDRATAAAAEECARSIADAVRRRDRHQFAAELRWALSSPTRTISAMARKIIQHR